MTEDPNKTPAPSVPDFGDVPSTGTAQSPFEHAIQRAVGRATLAMGAGLLLALVTGIAVEVIRVQRMDERQASLQRDVAAVHRRMEDVEERVEQALDLRVEMRALKAVVEAGQRESSRRLDRIEDALDRGNGVHR